MTISAQTDSVNFGTQKQLTHYTKTVTGGVIHVFVARDSMGNPDVATTFQANSAGIYGKYVSITTGTGTLAAGNITGAVECFLDCSGQAAITLTTRTATQMVADVTPAMAANDTYIVTVINRNSGLLTLAGGTGVTITGPAVIPSGGMRRYHVTINSSTTLTMQHVEVDMPAAKYTNITTGTGTASAGDLTGATTVSADYSGQAGITITTRTAAQMIADAGLQINDTYRLLITNRNSGTLTLAAGTNVTLTGTMTAATNTTREFVVTITSASALTIQSVGVGTIS